MKILNIVIRPRILLMVGIVLTLLAITSISARIFLRTLLPEILINYNTAGYSLILSFLSCLTFIIFIWQTDLSTIVKILSIPFILISIMLFIVLIGHNLTKPYNKLYFRVFKNELTELTTLCQNQRISLIKRLPNGKIKIFQNKDSIQNERIFNLSQKLKFKSISVKEQMLIIYEFSMWGGYGLCYTERLITEPEMNQFGGKYRDFYNIGESFYYFAFD